MQVTAWRLTTMDEKFSDTVFATADQAVGQDIMRSKAVETVRSITSSQLSIT